MSIEEFRANPTVDAAIALLEGDGSEAALAWALEREVWDALADEKRQVFAEALAKRLEIELVGLRPAPGGRTLAHFGFGPLELVLIPGDEVELGWERAPLDALQEDWEAVRAQVDRPHAIAQILQSVEGAAHDLPPAELHRWLDGKLSSHRKVRLEPHLLEALPARVDWSDVAGDDPDLHFRLASHMRKRGFRLPTADEWEHACAGGRRSLFRWGDEWPKQSDTYTTTDGPATEPNDLGISFGVDPYWPEMVAEPDQMRGGDGGEMVCGGAPPFATWITQMSSFVYDLRYLDYRTECLRGALHRVALSVFPEHDAPVLRFEPPDPRTDQHMAHRYMKGLVDRFGGLRATANRLEALKAEVPMVLEVAAGHLDDELVQRLACHVLRKAHEDDAALKAGQRALELERWWPALTALASAHRVRGEIDEAVALFEQAFELEPKDPAPYLDIAEMLAQAERFEEAIAANEKVLSVDPNNGWATPALLHLKAKHRGDDAAKAELEAYIEANPRHQYARRLFEEL